MSIRGDFIAYVDEDGHLGICDITDPETSIRFAGTHDALASCVCLHPEEAIVATGGIDQQVLVWDIASEHIVDSFKVLAEDTEAKQLVNPPFVYAVDFVPDETTVFVRSNPDILATAGLDCMVKLWNTDAVVDPSDKPASIAQHELAEKPNALATLDSLPLMFTDQGRAIVAYCIR
ncbi:hypothetical protein H4R23_000997 [Coemansia sp. Cherry 401B]|nr:hypothetical protein H4R23_000997 [Coemansia sp. Cherry 401B]